MAVLLAVFAAGAVQAQHHVGVRAGYGMGSIGRIEPAETSSGSLWGLKHGGVSYKFYGRQDRFANGVQIDLQYLEKGFRRRGIYYSGAPSDTMTVYTRRINSIELPVFWHPYVTFLKDRFGVFLNLGIDISYNISSTYKWSGQQPDENNLPVDVTYEEGDYPMRLNRDNRWNYGLVGGFGVNYIRGRHEFYFEGRYHVGYSDILKNRTVYPDNPRQSPLDAMNFSLGYFYRIGKDRE